MGKQTRIEYSAVWTTIRPDLIDHPDWREMNYEMSK
jgi:hypothetical protein